MSRLLIATAVFAIAAGSAWAQPAGGPPPGGARPPGPATPAPPPSKNPADAPNGTYAMDKTHATVILHIWHMDLSNYAIRMSGVDGSIAYDSAKPEQSKISATIDPKSLDVANDKINAQFAKEFLDPDTYPTITFASTSIKNNGGGKGTMTGDLTMHGATKPVTLNVTFNGTRAANGPGGASQRLGFTASGTVKPADWGVPLGPLPNEMQVDIQAEFVMKK